MKESDIKAISLFATQLVRLSRQMPGPAHALLAIRCADRLLTRICAVSYDAHKMAELNALVNRNLPNDAEADALIGVVNGDV